ncbi:hypothetical protein PR048_025438 [Dryococelus australis]|uniref:Uncharacterized protein n=1 Tax=Dryococelus australis TaxID=614101 RepID=A0ABQ9GRB4_9NEOP|nr:hypothetical protein PR048_025438 [Dryococelus australis]
MWTGKHAGVDCGRIRNGKTGRGNSLDVVLFQEPYVLHKKVMNIPENVLTSGKVPKAGIWIRMKATSLICEDVANEHYLAIQLMVRDHQTTVHTPGADWRLFDKLLVTKMEELLKEEDQLARASGITEAIQTVCDQSARRMSTRTPSNMWGYRT